MPEKWIKILTETINNKSSTSHTARENNQRLAPFLLPYSRHLWRIWRRVCIWRHFVVIFPPFIPQFAPLLVSKLSLPPRHCGDAFLCTQKVAPRYPPLALYVRVCMCVCIHTGQKGAPSFVPKKSPHDIHPWPCMCACVFMYTYKA